MRLVVSLLALVLSTVALHAQKFWESTTGPAASVTCLAANTKGMVFAGTDLAGMYRTSDLGQTWEWLNDGNEGSGLDLDKPIKSVDVDANNVIFVCQAGNGVYKSTDDGVSWIDCNNASLPSKQVVHATIKNRPGQPTMVAVGIDGGPSMRRMYLSEDAGATWTQVSLPGVAYTAVFQVHISPDPSSTKLWCMIGYNKGLFRTTDVGASWRRIDTDPSSGEDSDNYRNMVWTSNTRVFVGRNQLQGSAKCQNACVLRSDDDGETWKYCLTGWPTANFQSNYVSGFGVGKGDEIFATTFKSGTFYSSNAGDNWSEKKDGMVDFNGDQTDGSANGLVVTYRNHVFIGTLGGFVSRHIDPTTYVQDNPLPEVLSLGAPMPNPGVDRIHMPLTLDVPASVTARVYASTGMEVLQPYTQMFEAGTHDITFATAYLPSGVYCYRVEANGTVRSGTFTVQR
ncbi:MAG: hypothetical protein JSS89_06400 [Bacteroidetes bacterium]|nr:hypothetical protein [Bacteroidota bacterium]